MNILMLCYEYPPLGGGGGIGVRQYAEAWAAKGHRVAVLTGRARGLEARESINGVEIIRVRSVGRKDLATATLVSMISYSLAGLLHVLRNRGHLRQFEVLNTHFSIPTGPLGWTAASLLRIPQVLTIVGGDIYDPTKRSSPHRIWVLRRANRWIINAADRVVAISRDTKSRAEQFYEIHRPIEVINYGLSPAFSRDDAGLGDPGFDASAFLLIAVGRLVPRKGFEYLVRAMRLLPENVRLLLIGDGPLGPTLRELAREQGVLSRIRFLGFQPREKVREYMRKADCFVLSSLHEGLGIVVQEAMDAGLPIVATDSGGQVDLIHNHRNGFLVEPGNPDALAAAILKIWSDPGLANSMERNNLADIRELYVDGNCELYLDLFRQLIASPSQSGQAA